MEESQTELDMLKEKATSMGITFNNRIGTSTLKERINKKQGEIEKSKAGNNTTPVHKTRSQIIKDMSKLKRVNITSRNPQHSKMKGVILNVGNDLKMFKKLVMFETDTHIPQVIYDHMKNNTIQTFVEKRNPDNGRKYKVSKFIKEYVIQDLPPLTAEELEEIKDRQERIGTTE